jgi:uncharacterized membrane protein
MNKSPWPLIKSILACVVGTIVAVISMFVSVYIRKSFVAQSFIAPMPYINESLRFAVGIGLIVLVCLLLIGLPIQAAMQKERVVGYIWHVIPAVLFGIVLFTGVQTLLDSFESSISIHDIIRGAGLGFIASSVAWAIRRPDLDSYDKVLATINGTLRSGPRKRSRSGMSQSRAHNPSLFTR